MSNPRPKDHHPRISNRIKRIFLESLLPAKNWGKRRCESWKERMRMLFSLQRIGCKIQGLMIGDRGVGDRG